MCDYSLHNVKSRPAKVGDKLTTHNFNTGTRGYSAQEDANMADCVLPGTELAFKRMVMYSPRGFFSWKGSIIAHTTAIFGMNSFEAAYQRAGSRRARPVSLIS